MGLSVISGDFLFNAEKVWKVVNELAYFNMLPKLWAGRVMKTRPMESKSERLIWLLDTASIEPVTVNPTGGGEEGGNISFDEMSTVTTEFFPQEHRKGFKINKIKYMNFANAGLDPIGKWMAGIGAYGAYYHQRLLALAILNGANVTAYDGLPYWSNAHLVHPNIPSMGTFANDFTGAVSGSYPGALPIDDSVSVDTALTNLGIALSYIVGSVPQPNGQGDPRIMEPLFMLHAPRMRTRVNELMDADFIPQVASSGAGSGDIKAVWKKFRNNEPIEVPEFAGARSYTAPSASTTGPTTITGNDKTYYIVAREAEQSELGAWVETLRQPFTMHTYSGEGGADGMDAVLGRSHDLEYHYDGWMSVNPGHYWTMFRFQGS